jgi:hypothetical protein
MEIAVKRLLDYERLSGSLSILWKPEEYAV